MPRPKLSSVDRDILQETTRKPSGRPRSRSDNTNNETLGSRADASLMDKSSVGMEEKVNTRATQDELNNAFISKDKKKKLTRQEQLNNAFIDKDSSGDEDESLGDGNGADERESAEREVPSSVVVGSGGGCPLGFFGGDTFSRLSLLGYLLAFGVVYFTQERWINHQLAVTDEGALVTRVSVALLPLFSLGFIMWAQETADAIVYLNEMGFPGLHFKLTAWSQHSVLWKLFRLLKGIFFIPAAGLAASRLWKATWRNLVCKSFHDKSCKYNAFGRLLASYRNSACLDGPESPMCERAVTYIPFYLVTLIALTAGVGILPYLNNFLVRLLQDIRKATEEALMARDLVDNNLLGEQNNGGAPAEVGDKPGEVQITRRRSPRFAGGDGDNSAALQQEQQQ